MPSHTLFANRVTAEPSRPKLILPFGSGRTGKTFWSRCFIDRAASHRLHIDIVDGDTINPGLAPVYGSALAPPATMTTGDHPAWFEKTIASAIEGRRSAILDLGRWLFDDWFVELPLAEAVEQNDADLIAVYLLTPDSYSLPRLPYLLNLIKPSRTLIVLNEWGLDENKGRAVFAPVLANSIVAAAQADGARIVTMPHLDDAHGLTALGALPRDRAERLTAHPALGAWLNRMEENFAPVADWLA